MIRYLIIFLALTLSKTGLSDENTDPGLASLNDDASAGITTPKGKTTLKLSLTHNRDKSVYTERNNLGVITFQENTRYQEYRLQAKLNHGVTDNWEVGIILPLSDIEETSTETVGGNAVNKTHKKGIANLQLTTAIAHTFNQGDTHLLFEGALGLPTDTRSQRFVGGASGSLEISATHYFGPIGIKGLLARDYWSPQDWGNWVEVDTHKFGINGELSPNLYGSVMVGKNNNFDVGEITLGKSLEKGRLLELTLESDLSGNRDARYLSLEFTYPLN